MDSLLHQHPTLVHNQNNESNTIKRTSQVFDDKEDIVIEINRDEMKTYHDET